MSSLKEKGKELYINEHKTAKAQNYSAETVTFPPCKTVLCILSDSLCPLSHREREYIHLML